MSTNPKQLVVELQKKREAVCKIVGTRESLLLLAHDLSAAAQARPERMTSSQFVHLPGWEQNTLDAWEDGVVFEAQPDIVAYLEKRRASSSRILPLLHAAFGVILVALALIGLRAVWLWIF